jgi:glycerol-3-phosphate dehydrogenase
MTDTEIEKLADALVRRLNLEFFTSDMQEALEDRIMDILKLCIRVSLRRLSDTIAEVEKDL